MKIHMHVTGLEGLKAEVQNRADMIAWLETEMLRRLGEKALSPNLARAARRVYRKHIAKLKAQRAAGVYFGRN